MNVSNPLRPRVVFASAGTSFLRGGFVLVLVAALAGALLEHVAELGAARVRAAVIPTTEGYDALFEYWYADALGKSDFEISGKVADLPDLTPFGLTIPFAAWLQPTPFALYALVVALASAARFRGTSIAPDGKKRPAGLLPAARAAFGVVSGALALAVAVYVFVDLAAWPAVISWDRPMTLAWAMIFLLSVFFALPASYVVFGLWLAPVAAVAERRGPLGALARGFGLAQHIRPKFAPAIFGFVAVQAAVSLFMRPSLPAWACGAADGAAAGLCALVSIELFSAIRNVYEAKEFLAPKGAMR